MNFFETLFSNLLTLTVAFAGVAIMIALAIHAVRNILRQQKDEEKK